MNKTEVLKEVSKETGIDFETVRKVVNAFAHVIQKSLLFGMDVKIAEFASFVIMVSPEKKKINPRTKEDIIVPKQYRIKTILPKDFISKIKQKTVY